MARPVSAQMLAAYSRTSARANQIRERDQDPFSDIDNFEFDVRNQFLLGVHSAFSKDIIAWLRRNVGNQQQIADALGLKDRTSISKMLRSGTMDGIRITAALNQYGSKIPLPSPERAALSGFARATSYVKAKIYQDDSIEDSMTPQEFSDLLGMLASDDWDDAIKDPNPIAAREVAVRIIRATETIIEDQPTRIKLRPEQCVMILQDVHESWGDFGVVTLCAIPDCIPDSDSRTEARL